MAFHNRTKPSTTTRMTGLLAVTTTSPTLSHCSGFQPSTNVYGSENRLFEPPQCRINTSSSSSSTSSSSSACVIVTSQQSDGGRSTGACGSGCDSSSASCSSGGSCVAANNDTSDDSRFHRTWQRCRWFSNQIVFVTLLLFVTMSPVGLVRGEITCPPYQEIPYCSCFVLDDQLHIQCSGSDIPALKKSLQVLNGPVKSYSVYDLDARATVLPDGVTDNVTSPVFHVQLSHSSLEDLSEGSLRGLSKSLESLAIVSGRLKFIPQSTLSTLRRLKVLDFEGNQIQELGSYSFHKILLQKVNLKANLLENISELAFLGLEETLMEIDLSENKLKAFPYSPLRRLRLLGSLNLAWNEISELNVLSSASSSASLLLSPLSSASRPKTGATPSLLSSSGAAGPSALASSQSPSSSSGGSFGVIRYGTSSSSSTSSGSSLGSSSSLLYPSSGSGASGSVASYGSGSYNHNNNHNSNTNLEWPMLKYLNLNSNYLRKLDRDTFAAMGNLRTLSIHLNSIEMVDEEAFSSLTELESIDLSHNKIIHLPSATFRYNTRLTSIDLSNNHLHLVSEGLFNNLPELRELFLNGNNILQLTGPTFLNSVKIGIIYLQGNALRLVDSGVFSPLRNLTEVRLSDNFLTNLPQDLFLNNQALASLSLDGNLLTKVVPDSFKNCKGLRELRLQNNRIMTLEPGVVDGLDYLQEVHLENNKLTRIRGLKQLKRLRHVSLSRNNIQKVTMEMLPGTELSSLSLGHCLINSIENGSFSNQTTLSILFLGSNRLTKLMPEMFFGLRALERLYLQRNNISWIHDECFSSHTKALQYIDLSYNLIKMVSRSVFSGLAFIEEINLSHNEITELEEGSFANLRSLRILDLSYNRLRTVDYTTTFHVSGLEILKICCNSLVEFHVLSGPNSYGYGNVGNSGEKYGMTGGNTGNTGVGIGSGSSSVSSSGGGGGYASMMLHGGILIPGIVGGNIQIALKELDLRQNQLTASTLRQIEMGRLEVLQISGNNLTDLDEATLFGFPMLSFLAAETSRITALPTNIFLKNPNLAVVRLSDNSLTHIPDFVFNPNANIANQHAGGESMASISNRASGGGGGTGVSTSGVTSTSSSIKSHLALRELHLRYNRIPSFPYKALVNATTLEVLTLSGNRINTLDLNRISLPRLKQFDMADNGLSKISGLSLAKSMPLLEVADFGENNISKISSDFVKNVSLTQLNFGGNAMQKVPFAFSERFITTPFLLNMSRNPLINFYTENHPSKNFSVMDLYLSDTNVSFLTSEQFKIYPKLHRLVVKRNPITALPPNAFSSLSHLNLLDLSENDIEEVKHDSFTGLVQLKSLNLSHNRIKTLTSFHPHLGGLQDLDLSNNQLNRLMPEVFANLVSLVSLRLRGNWLSGLPAELFAPLARLSVLDLSHNFIETVPATVLRHLETRISTLRLEENPLSCDCDSNDFWEWLQSHPKIFAVSISVNPTASGLIGEPKFVCEKPEELRGKLMIEMDIPTLCAAPAIVKLAIQDVRPSSAVVSWQGRNISALQGYMIAYHALNRDNQIRWTRPLPAISRAYKLPDLESDTPYRVCVLELATDGDPNEAASTLASRSAETVLKDTHISRCTQVRTTVHPSDSERWAVLIQRRLGVIVGAVLGVVVFVILLTTLACVKLRKRRLHRQQDGILVLPQNGKIDHHLTDALTAPNNVGTLGGYHHNNQNNHRHHHLHHHLHHGSNGNGGTASPGNLSPEFLTYRHYSLTTDSGTCIHPSQATTTELERL